MIEQNEFAAFDSTAGVLAYIFQKLGSAGLADLLQEVDYRKAELERDAAEIDGPRPSCCGGNRAGICRESTGT
jgi:hypothetical protein